MRDIRAHIVICLLLVMSSMLCAQQLVPAGITADKANPITEPTMLTVQSGSNYIRFDEERLPAVVTYTSSEAFGPIPAALSLGDTIKAELVFADCGMAWRWTVEEGEGDKIVEIKAHESAVINAAPYMCNTTFGDTTAVAYDSFTWYEETLTTSGDYTHVLTNAAGCDSILTLHLTIEQATCTTTFGDTTAVAYDSFTWYEETLATSGDYTHVLTNAAGCDSILTLHLTIEQATCTTTFGDTTAVVCESFRWYSQTLATSGDYTHVLMNAAGCDSIVTLHLTIEHNCGSYDTAYFCRGFNTEHEELMAGGVIRRYRPYVFESPAEWDYMEGVIVEREHDRALVDLRRAEKNLYAHYVGQLTPISSIRWSVQYDGKGQYEPLTVTNNPQWIATGHVAVQISFLCGELYNTEFPTDIDQVSQEMVSIKRIENGRVVIIRGGAKYDMFGTKIQ
ncbi:MAG: hypothetical protein IKP57_02840 [Paludibacteraceae bacterium]|nr:hypothetical protein [Paludibacteraceae bacterium]